MIRSSFWMLVLAAVLAVIIPAGGLHLEVGNPDASLEAKALNAALVTRVTACREPAKSTVSATVVRVTNGQAERTPLKVVPLKKHGMFAIIGPVSGPAAIELAVTNPEYGDYKPRLLIRVDASGIQWANLKRFGNNPISVDDVKAVLGS